MACDERSSNDTPMAINGRRILRKLFEVSKDTVSA